MRHHSEATKEHRERSPADQREHRHVQSYDLLNSQGLRRCPRTRSCNPHDLRSNGVFMRVPTVYLMRPFPPIPSTSTKQSLSPFPSHEGLNGPNPTRAVLVISHPSSAAVWRCAPAPWLPTPTLPVYHVPDVVLLFRQLRGWFKLRVLSTFVVGGPCCFLGIFGMLFVFFFDYTDRTSTLLSSATVITPTSVSIILISSSFLFATRPLF